MFPQGWVGAKQPTDVERTPDDLWTGIIPTTTTDDGRRTTGDGTDDRERNKKQVFILHPSSSFGTCARVAKGMARRLRRATPFFRARPRASISIHTAGRRARARHRSTARERMEE